MTDFNEKYVNAITKRKEEAQSTQSLEKDYRYTIGEVAFHIYMPDNVLEQKSLIQSMYRLQGLQVDSVEYSVAEQDFLNKILKYTERNNQQANINMLTLPEVETLLRLYQDVLLLPFAIWGMQETEKNLSEILDLNKD